MAISRSSSFSKNTIIYLAGGIVAAGGNILLAPIYLRLLSPQEYGLWSHFGFTLLFFQTVMTWGIMATIVRLLIQDDYENRGRKIAAAMQLVTVLNAMLLLLLALVTHYCFASYTTSNSILLAGLLAAFVAYPSILLGLYIADGKAVHYRMWGLIGFILQSSTLGIGALLFNMTAKNCIIAATIAAAIHAVLSIYQLRKFAKWDFLFADYKQLFFFGAPLVFYTLSGQSNDLIVRYLLVTRVGTIDFGAFSVGIMYASIIAMIASAINLAWIPLFYRHANQWLISGLYQRFIDLMLVATSLCVLFLIIFSNELLAVYSGNNFTVDSTVCSVLLIAAWFNSAVWMAVANPLFHQKRTQLLLKIVIVSFVLSLPLTYVLIMRFGTLGASFALLVNAILLCSIATFMLYKIVSFKFNYMNFAIIVIVFLLTSSPLMSLINKKIFSVDRLALKISLFAIILVIFLLLKLRSGFNLLKFIESEAGK